MLFGYFLTCYIGRLNLSGVWFGDGQRTNAIDTTFKEIGLRLQFLFCTLHLIANTTGRTYVYLSNQQTCICNNNNLTKEDPIFADVSSQIC